MKAFPLGVLKDESTSREGWTRRRQEVSPDLIPAILGSARTIEDESQQTFTSTHVPMCYRDPRIKIAGFGGQGLLFLGRLLAEAGMRQGYHVSWIPSYGPEMRGGTANCHVNLSTEPIGSPLVSDPTVLIAMNRPSIEKFEAELVSGGLLIYDSSLIDIAPTRKDIEVIPLPATSIADQLGSAKAANMVVLGAYFGITNLLSEQVIASVIKAMTRNPSAVDLNMKAVASGTQFIHDRSAAEVA
jgi:Pyruvate/2-oxoacid:ferredoxin oxidoreductase gamma subunit